jgi:hypothetical protein
LFTYTLEALFSPTSTTAKQGCIPLFFNCSTSVFTSCLISDEIAFPSIIVIFIIILPIYKNLKETQADAWVYDISFIRTIL